MLPNTLDPVSVRVLGSLLEKELATPDHYPLSLHALTSACNQTSNREPVMTLEEDTVSRALDVLRRASVVRSFQGIGSRVSKYQHLLNDASDLSRNEQAVLCVLLLRGPQTLAELRTRASRLASNADVHAIEASLEAMMARDPLPVVSRLPRLPGQKEARYAQLLGGEVVFDTNDNQTSGPATPTSASDRIAALEELTRDLQNELADVRAQLETFRKQFE